MNAVDRHQLLAALMALVVLLFVSGGWPPVARWRRQIRLAAIIAFCIALAAALGEIVWWWSAGVR